MTNALLSEPRIPVEQIHNAAQHEQIICDMTQELECNTDAAEALLHHISAFAWQARGARYAPQYLTERQMSTPEHARMVQLLPDGTAPETDSLAERVLQHLLHVDDGEITLIYRSGLADDTDPRSRVEVITSS